MFRDMPIGKDIVGIDGGAVWNVNIESAVKRCREVVDSDDKIVVDVLLCSSWEIEKADVSKNAFENYQRFREIRKFYASTDNVYE